MGYLLTPRVPTKVSHSRAIVSCNSHFMVMSVRFPKSASWVSGPPLKPAQRVNKQKCNLEGPIKCAGENLEFSGRAAYVVYRTSTTPTLYR